MNKKWRIAPYLFIAPAVLMFAFAVLIPIVLTFSFSFFKWKGYGSMTFTGFDNYVRAFQDHIYVMSYVHIFEYILLTILLEIVVGLALAGLITMNFRGTGLFRVAFFTPMMLPMVIVSYLWAFVYNADFGLVNSLLHSIGLDSWQHVWLGEKQTAMIAVSVVSGWVSAGFYMTIFYAGIQRIPKEVYEAAHLDGANEWQVFFRIKIPMIMDLVEVGLLLCILGGFQAFDLFYVMTNGGPNNKTEIVTTYLVKVVFKNGDVGYGSALAVLMTIVITLIGILFNKLKPKDAGKLEY
ncbi:carbohydrate ABC transporter permease [Paenibacillus sp. BC26]|uniref:carbohydrate ABC transporter permease n=1 Tax=Paenibacillus sp. BC26 TaxID=1881032 RepID=UPI0008F1D9CF|nr:sugar ABC transporter permease [Paenibacillus sp. BC26]SFT20637.1 carbohydrate ABC transporter membrane protein 1, CUT1 family [Paenibacillus sp. BC26]